MLLSFTNNKSMNCPRGPFVFCSIERYFITHVSFMTPWLIRLWKFVVLPECNILCQMSLNIWGIPELTKFQPFKIFSLRHIRMKKWGWVSNFSIYLLLLGPNSKDHSLYQQYTYWPYIYFLNKVTMTTKLKRDFKKHIKERSNSLGI